VHKDKHINGKYHQNPIISKNIHELLFKGCYTVNDLSLWALYSSPKQIKTKCESREQL